MSNGILDLRPSYYYFFHCYPFKFPEPNTSPSPRSTRNETSILSVCLLRLFCFDGALVAVGFFLRHLFLCWRHRRRVRQTELAKTQSRLEQEEGDKEKLRQRLHQAETQKERARDELNVEAVQLRDRLQKLQAEQVRLFCSTSRGSLQ